MGSKYNLFCSNCSWRRSITIGSGKFPWGLDEPDFLDEKILLDADVLRRNKRGSLSIEEKAESGKYGLPLKAFAGSNAKTPIYYADDDENETIFYCEKCHSFEKSSIDKIKYVYNEKIIKVSITPYCQKCDREMVDILGSGVHLLDSDLRCPKCGSIVNCMHLLFD